MPNSDAGSKDPAYSTGSKDPAYSTGSKDPAYNTVAPLRYSAPYMEWAKTRPSADFDLATSNILACSLDDLPGAHEALSLSGDNENGYKPLLAAIASHYGTTSDCVATAQGTSGANFLVYAALLEPGDEVLIESPGYDPLLGAARLFSATVVRLERPFSSRFTLDPERVAGALTSRTKLIVITHPHNPSGVPSDAAALQEIGRIADRVGAHVLVDEVYLDVTAPRATRAASLGDAFITTSSLTKAYGLSSLRCGWAIASAELTVRLRRARDVVDGTGSIVTERLAELAFSRLDDLRARAARILTSNRALVHELFASHTELEWVPSSGTVIFPRIRGVADAALFVERLMRQYRTAVVPGRFFDAPGHFRVGLGGDTNKLRGGLECLGAALDDVKSR